MLCLRISFYDPISSPVFSCIESPDISQFIVAVSFFPLLSHPLLQIICAWRKSVWGSKSSESTHTLLNRGIFLRAQDLNFLSNYKFTILNKSQAVWMLIGDVNINPFINIPCKESCHKATHSCADPAHLSLRHNTTILFSDLLVVWR